MFIRALKSFQNVTKPSLPKVLKIPERHFVIALKPFPIPQKPALRPLKSFQKFTNSLQIFEINNDITNFFEKVLNDI